MLLTGASGSIGAEVARQLALRGAKLALTARNEEKLHALAKEIAAAGGEPPVALPADLSQRGSAEQLAARATEALGTVDVLINNAGVTMEALTWVGGDGGEARELFETNLWSPFALVAALAPSMIERSHGVIVNVSSMAGLSPIPRLGHYGASRAGLALATETMQQELSTRGVRVIEVVFGPIDTPTARENRVLGGGGNQMKKKPGFGKLEPAAETIVNAVDGDTEGVIFYPGMLKVSSSLPFVMRLMSKVAGGKADLHDTAIRFGPTAGSDKPS